MKILVVIPHFFREEVNAKHGSQKKPQARIRAISYAILSLQQLFGSQQSIIQIGKRVAIPANKSTGNVVDIIICTTGENHLINHLTLPSNFYQHHPTSAEPLFLGFECQRVLGENLAQEYDFYCYLEDDLIIQDSSFFQKLTWFNHFTNKVKLLQPNRYELALNQYTKKCYIDGDLAFHVTKPFQNIEVDRELKGQLMNQPIVFQRALNPHSGCFFLTHEQLKYWAEKDYFAQPQTDFIGALESAATLGLMKTFQIYKTTPEYANFLEIQHYGNAFANLLGSVVQVSSD